MSVTLGTDPEIFLRDSRTGGVVPVCGLIGGDKGKPVSMGGGFGVQEDNVMLEFNTPASDSPEGFRRCVQIGVEKCADLIRVRQPHLELDNQAERLFTHQQLDDPRANRFGCSPDFDGHNHGEAHAALSRDVLRDDGGEWRFAGGHVHLGFAPKYDVPKWVAAAFGDVFLGLSAVGCDKQVRRRALYGAPGRFRPTKYGIEYRTLSNFWVQEHAYLDQVAYRAYALGTFLEGATEARMHKLFREIPWADVRSAMNTGDESRAADVAAHIRHDLGMTEIDL